MIDRSEAISFLLERPDEYGRMIGFKDLSEIHRGWMRKMLTQKDDYTLQAHRGSYKTTCVSLVLAILMILLPNKRILFLRKTDTDVKEVVRQVRNILLHPKTQYLVLCIYGVYLRFTIDNATELSTNLTTVIKGAPQLTAMGTQASITGKHYDFIFTDDIVNLKDRQSRAERDRIKTIYEELQNVKELDGGRIFNTGTPWHPNDAFEIMPEPEKWDCYSTGIMTEEAIQERREKQTGGVFAANYLLKHIPSEDILFKDPATGADAALAEQGWSHVDAAFYGEDYTALTILAIHGGKFYVYGRCWRKHVDDVTDEIVELHNRFKTGKMHIELNADKGYVAKQLRKKGLKVGTYHESQNKFVKISSYLKFEWSNVVFVEGTDKKYIEQICDYNEDAPHDDCPDSLASLIRIVAKRKNNSEALEQYEW